MKKIYPYGRQHITDEDIKRVSEVLRSDYITQGPMIGEFECAFAGKVNAKFAVAFNSGTSALHGAYFALGIDPGAEFITSPITFVATANAGLYLGHRPVFCEVEPDTGNINADLIEGLVTENTRFIVPVHFSGHPSNLSKIKQIADKYGLKVVEDAAHATGALFKGNPVGDSSFSDMAIFSFHPVKHIATGEGGMVVTNSEEYYKRLLVFRTHGITKENMLKKDEGDWYYEMHHLGYNYRMTDIQAALGLSQLERLNENIAKRRMVADLYKDLLGDNPYFDLPVEKEYAQSAYHLYPIRLKDHLIDRKKEVFAALRDAGLWVQTHYIPVHTQPYYRQHGYEEVSLPVSEKYYRSEISIPMYHSLERADVKEIADRILKTVSSI